MLEWIYYIRPTYPLWESPGDITFAMTIRNKFGKFFPLGPLLFMETIGNCRLWSILGKLYFYQCGGLSKVLGSSFGK